jgi:metallophosphoesterase (TIGR00282 family)
MRILVIGDIVGKSGRKTVARLVPELRDEFGCAFCVANGENAAGGAGLTERCAHEIRDAGVDAVTGGDHIWDRREFVDQIARTPWVLRPANVASGQPGAGSAVFTTADGRRIGVINLLGRVFMQRQSDCPFAAADAALAALPTDCAAVIVDIHAEATSEKIAMGYHLDGRATVVVGTHTHVQTADERVLPEGTAYISDLGMVGARDSVLGCDKKAVLRRFRTGLPARLTVVEDGVVLHGVVVTVDDDSGRATGIERIERAG